MTNAMFPHRAPSFLVAGLSLLTIACWGCSHKASIDSTSSEPTKPTAPLFEEATDTLGVTFVHDPADHEQTYFMPKCVGSGAAFLDYDGDGLLDLYLLQNNGSETGKTNRLYRQTPTGFLDVTEGSGLGIAAYGMGVACGDVNNDGKTDVLLNNYGQAHLLLNRTEGTEPHFVDITDSCGLENRMWGTSTCFFDYNRDGLLDMLLVNYVNYDPSRKCRDGGGRPDYCGPDAFKGRVTRLFEHQGIDNDGNVKFVDVTIPSGLGEHAGPGLGVFCADFNADRWPDIFIANDGQANHLWINQKDGTFREEAVTRGVGYNSMGKTEADMGVAIGDVDNDGLFDIFVTHLTSETHTLWSQGPPGVFVDKTATSGLAAAAWRGTGFGTAMADLENDGDLDLIIANGRVDRISGSEMPTTEELPDFWRDYAERDQVMINEGNGEFVDRSADTPALSGLGSVSRGLACADFDNDGDMDLLVTRIADRPSLLRNVAKQAGHWLGIRAIDPQLNRDAYGAEVYVNAGDQRWMRWINPGYSYLSSNDPRAHFGLGEKVTIDSIEVIWPDGSKETFPGPAVDQYVTVRRGDGQSVE
ncbi:MAG: CRTAC1 family protein [Pirellulaceae bacterium]|nr:CRTAC1 family protein [Pirellulaceae bacterium]